MEDYKALYKNIRVLRDDTGGLVSLSLLERHGQDRATKVKNNFTGQLYATDSQTLLSLTKLLNEKLPAPSENEIVIGMITSGIIMCGYLALARGSRFNYSVPEKVGAYEQALYFTEGHRDDKAHYLYGLKPGDEVIIVEDEVTTGNGVIALAHALRAYGVKINGIASVNEIVNFGAQEKIQRETGIKLASLIESELLP